MLPTTLVLHQIAPDRWTIYRDNIVIGWVSRGGCENDNCHRQTAEGRKFHAIERRELRRYERPESHTDGCTPECWFNAPACGLRCKCHHSPLHPDNHFANTELAAVAISEAVDS